MQSNVTRKLQGHAWRKSDKWTLHYNKQRVEEAAGVPYSVARAKESELIRTGKYNRSLFCVLPHKKKSGKLNNS